MAGGAHAVDLAQRLIRCPSVTPAEGGALDLLEAELSAIGFACTRLPFGEGNARIDNLFARYGDTSPHLCFAGHTDVVPAGDAAAWRHDPFGGTVVDGKLFGRGAADMKGGVAAFVAAANPHNANTAVFYSISNCQMALKGVSFGSFLIKQVVSEIQQEFKEIKQFVTLSPVPGLRKWAHKMNTSEGAELSDRISKDISVCCNKEEIDQSAILRLTYHYLTHIKNKSGDAINPVAHFHLGNGASIYKIHVAANSNQVAIDESWGVMVNYLYDLDLVAKNHESYANKEPIAVSSKLTKSIQSKKKKLLAY